MATGHILGLSGSLRVASVNTMLMAEAARLFDPASFTRADLRLPLYDGDLEAQGMPDAVARLVDQIAAADAVIISGPEYNKSISGVLKNALDWVSRTRPNPWRDKPVALMSATAGRAGGERAQWIMRLALNPFRPRLLVGPEILVGSAASQFDAEGRLTNDRYIATLTELMSALRAEAGLQT
jgi:chromate reductase, NAD(P)H dehydrogenase (quinone)